MTISKSAQTILLTLLIGAGVGMAACGKEESALDKAKDSVGDALNLREHEKLKDAAEDAKAAVQDAAAGVKEEVKKATEK